MKNLDDIHHLIQNSTLILVINASSKTMSKTVFNYIYKKYSDKKRTITSTKGLLKKISEIKNTLIKIDIDIKKIQFSSSKTSDKLWTDFGTAQVYALDNESKLLFYAAQYQKEQFVYRFFDLILIVEKQQIRIKNRYDNDDTYSIEKLVRSTKLKEIALFSEKES